MLNDIIWMDMFEFFLNTFPYFDFIIIYLFSQKCCSTIYDLTGRSQEENFYYK